MVALSVEKDAHLIYFLQEIWKSFYAPSGRHDVNHMKMMSIF
ncbi:hypothetical protein CF149_23676 [Pseudomonas psychrophila]|nr:hypothetical protein CF149_23676 [Pseudomonas psychrophila]